MRVFLAIEHLTEPSLASAEMDAISRVGLPIPASDLEAQRWRSADDRVEFLAWTNEPGAFPARAWIAPDGAIGCVGRWAPAGTAPGSDDDPTRSVRSFRRGSGGVAAYDDPPGIHAWDGMAGMAPMFYQASEHRVAVSNRPLLAHLVATGRSVPTYDIDALPAFLSLGYYPGDLTPFLGLKLLPRGSDLRVQDGQTDVSLLADGPTVLVSDASAVASALVTACGFLRDAAHPIVCNLSGGRDSRIVAAALAAAGVPFTARTKGTRYHPDVVIAAEVAARLGVAHEIGSGTAREVQDRVDVDVVARTARSLRATDGLLTTHDNVPATRPGFDPVITVHGAGGELLRGGYAKLARSEELTDPDAFWRRLLSAAAPVVTSPARARLLPDAQSRSNMPIAAGIASLRQLYLDERVGRWASASAMATAASRAFFQPFLDGEVVERVLGCDPEDALSERLAFDVLGRLCPELTDLPITAHRWSFEGAGPSDRSPDRWPLRPALPVPVDAGGELDWRRTAGAGLDEEFRRRIFGPAADALFQIVDRPAVERILASRSGPELRTRSLGRAQLLWATYTAATLLSSDWLMEPPPTRPVHIDVRPTPDQGAVARLGRVGSWARRSIRRAVP